MFNVLLSVLLILVVWFSTVWPFTEDWGEYYALLAWSTVGMMLLTAAEELLTLFLTLETMTICLYLLTAFEKDKRRSAEGGLKYFVYGSVSSALFLFGLSLIYGLTGSTQLDSIHDALAARPANTLDRPGGQRRGGDGRLADAGRVRLQDRRGAVPPVGARRLRGGPRAGDGLGGDRVEGRELRRLDEGAPARARALVERGELDVASPGWIGVVAVLAAASMTFGNFAALAQTNFKRMLAYSSIAHAGYMLVGVAAAGVSRSHAEAAGAVLFYLVVYAVANLGAFALAAWLARDKGSDEIADLNGLAARAPGLATCLLLLMLSLIGMPPLAGFFGKLYMFMEALDETNEGRLTLLWLVALGLLNSVVSAFYYVRVLKAMFLRPPAGPPLSSPPSSVTVSIVLAAAISLGFGLFPAPLINAMKAAAVPMLSEQRDGLRPTIDRSFGPAGLPASRSRRRPPRRRPRPVPPRRPSRRPRPHPSATEGGRDGEAVP